MLLANMLLFITAINRTPRTRLFESEGPQGSRLPSQSDHWLPKPAFVLPKPLCRITLQARQVTTTSLLPGHQDLSAARPPRPLCFLLHSLRLPKPRPDSAAKTSVPCLVAPAEVTKTSSRQCNTDLRTLSCSARRGYRNLVQTALQRPPYLVGPVTLASHTEQSSLTRRFLSLVIQAPARDQK